MTLLLGIESSCDETAVAVLDGQAPPEQRLLANLVQTQLQEHAAYGGVVPEIAARSHIAHMQPLLQRALQDADTALAELDAIAVTGGPGLIGGVMVGVMLAKGLAAALDKPFLAVNHLEAHALTVRLTEDLPFPFLMLLVSGGHCQILAVEAVGKYHRYGGTLDDALGEAFDKVAKMLDLGYPGGPAVERLASLGDPGRFALPRPLLDRPDCDFSFSGLKTAVRQEIVALGAQGLVTDRDKADICAAFQQTAGAVLADRITRAMQQFEVQFPGARRLVVAGGVAANRYLRGILTDAAQNESFSFHAPPLKLCTDNAAMIAWAGYERFRLGERDGLDFEPKARWPLAG